MKNKLFNDFYKEHNITDDFDKAAVAAHACAMTVQFEQGFMDYSPRFKESFFEGFDKKHTEYFYAVAFNIGDTTTSGMDGYMEMLGFEGTEDFERAMANYLLTRFDESWVTNDVEEVSEFGNFESWDEYWKKCIDMTYISCDYDEDEEGED